MKQKWEEPRIVVEQFVPNEYVAACGTTKTYIFECNAPTGPLYFYPYGDGKIDGVYTGKEKAYFCGDFYGVTTVIHRASEDSLFYDGFVDLNGNKVHDPGESAIVWIDTKTLIPLHGTRKFHATKELNMQEWETTKS